MYVMKKEVDCSRIKWNKFASNAIAIRTVYFSDETHTWWMKESLFYFMRRIRRSPLSDSKVIENKLMMSVHAQWEDETNASFTWVVLENHSRGIKWNKFQRPSCERNWFRLRNGYRKIYLTVTYGCPKREISQNAQHCPHSLTIVWTFGPQRA